MTKDLASFKLSKLAKEKGFDEPCQQFWEHNTQDGITLPGEFSYKIDWVNITDEAISCLRQRPGIYEKCGEAQRNSTMQPWLTARPTLAQLHSWLRDQHLTSIALLPVADDYWIGFLRGRLSAANNGWIMNPGYEDTLSKCLMNALKKIRCRKLSADSK